MTKTNILSGIEKYDDTMTVSQFNSLPKLPRGYGIKHMRLGVEYRLDGTPGKVMTVVPVYRRINNDDVVTKTYRLI